jgi:hypothetical protein
MGTDEHLLSPLNSAAQEVFVGACLIDLWVMVHSPEIGREFSSNVATDSICDASNFSVASVPTRSLQKGGALTR